VQEGWLNSTTALETIKPIMNGNAQVLFKLPEKTKVLQQVKWEPTKKKNK